MFQTALPFSQPSQNTFPPCPSPARLCQLVLTGRGSVTHHALGCPAARRVGKAAHRCSLNKRGGGQKKGVMTSSLQDLRAATAAHPLPLYVRRSLSIATQCRTTPFRNASSEHLNSITSEYSALKRLYFVDVFCCIARPNDKPKTATAKNANLNTPLDRALSCRTS